MGLWQNLTSIMAITTTLKANKEERQLLTSLHSKRSKYGVKRNLISPPQTPKRVHSKLQPSPKSSRYSRDTILPNFRNGTRLSNEAISKLNPQNLLTPDSFSENDSISFSPSAPKQHRCVLKPRIDLPLSQIDERLFIPTLSEKDTK